MMEDWSLADMQNNFADSSDSLEDHNFLQMSLAKRRGVDLTKEEVI